MAAATSTWTPPPGRHTVNLGNSLNRALKARQSGGDAQPTRQLIKKDFYSFRYNFKPGQVDSGARGKITTKKPKESSNVSVSVEHPSTRPGEMCLFTGEQVPSKEFDCVLIFDEASGTFTLEKLDSMVKLKYTQNHNVGGKTVSPPPAPPVPSVPDAMDIDQVADQLEREILSAAEGSDGEDVEIDQELFNEIIPPSFSRKNEQKPPPRAIPIQEEEEEEEDIPIAAAAKPPPPAPVAKPPKPAAKPKLAKSAAKATPKAAATPAQPSARTAAPAKSKVKPSAPQPAPPVSAAVATPTPAPAKTKPAPVPRPGKKKREAEPAPAPPVSASMGEDIEIFSLPKPPKRARVSPPPEPASEGWALPGATTAVSRPPPVVPPVSASSLPPPVAAAAMEESDDESDWDEVAAVDPVPAPTDPSAEASGEEDDDMFDIFGEAEKEEARAEGGEGDEHDIFASQLNQELGLTMEEDSDDDFLRDMVEEAPPSAVIPQREGLGAGPISLKAFAGDDDDDSEEDWSSDDSD